MYNIIFIKNKRYKHFYYGEFCVTFFLNDLSRLFLMVNTSKRQLRRSVLCFLFTKHFYLSVINMGKFKEIIVINDIKRVILDINTLII